MSQDDALTAAPKMTMGSTGPVDVTLTATRNGNTITVTGPGGGPSLPEGTPATPFNFTLIDNSGCNVKFSSLDSADDCSTCPPPSGQNSQQLVGVRMNNNVNPKTAGFTDNNNNNPANGPLNVAYQWNFTCDCSGVSVTPYDPIISNGGRV